MEKSSYHTITSADQQHLEDREKMNLYKEGECRAEAMKYLIVVEILII